MGRHAKGVTFFSQEEECFKEVMLSEYHYAVPNNIPVVKLYPAICGECVKFSSYLEFILKTEHHKFSFEYATKENLKNLINPQEKIRDNAERIFKNLLRYDLEHLKKRGKLLMKLLTLY